jgi:cardiolipin synthase (CMP-forming)
MRNWLTVPNLFTLARLAIAPFVVFEILHQRHMAAAALFAIAAATDLIDGYLARRLHSATSAGAYLDPIADKLLLSGVFLALAVIRSAPLWLVVVIFGRDLLILISSGAALLLTRLRAFPPSVWGKASTFFQILTAVAYLARNALGSPIFATICATLIWPAAALTVWSGIDYGWRGWRLVRID